MQFDRHGNRIWRDAQALLDSGHVRRSVGETAVPFGVCAEPSNVKAGGNACPYRFRRAGCDHFRTDVSYLPDLHAYLDDLLRNRERVLAATDIEEWAKTEAPRHHARHAPHPPSHHRYPPGAHRVNSTTPASAMAEGRQADSARRRRRVLKALDTAAPSGEEISVSSIARRAGVDRTFLCRHRDLLGQLHALETQPPNTAGTGPAVSRASLHADLLAAHLEQQAIDLRLQLEERDQDLDAARAANRDLMTRINAPATAR
jgi:hypothetical protein